MVVDKADSFLAEIEAVCRRYDLSIAHEDRHGAFLIQGFSEETAEWLKEATWDV